MLHTPMYMAGQTYPSKNERLLLATLGDSGVVAVGDLAVTPRAGGATMGVDIAAGLAFVSSTAGTYVCLSDAKEERPIAAAPSSGDKRIDLVVAQVYDPAETGTGTEFKWDVEVITGTASATPAVPATPARSIVLARVTLTSSTSTITAGTITNARARAASVADKAWPIVKGATLSAQTATTTAANWDEPIVIPAPNRPVRVVATLTGRFACGAEQANRFGEMALKLGFGDDSPHRNPEGQSGRSSDPLDSQVVTQIETWELEAPGVGQDLVITPRIRTVVEGTTGWSGGRLRVEVYPA